MRWYRCGGWGERGPRFSAARRARLHERQRKSCRSRALPALLAAVPFFPLLASAVIGEPNRQGAHRAMAFDSQEVKAGQCKVLQFGQHE